MRALRLFIPLMMACNHAFAGMPTVTLSDVAQLRVQGISFFIVIILLVAWGVRYLWNYLRRDFPRLPLLGFRRALALVVLLGLCFDIVLLMVAGTRELMTPGAWEKHGATYQLKSTGK